MDDPFGIGVRIDAACDAKDEAQLRMLGQECREKLAGATDVERVILRYYEANCHAGIGAVKSTESAYAWS